MHIRSFVTITVPTQDSAEDASGHRPRVLQRLEAILEEKLKSARQTIALLGPEEPGYSTSFLECSAYRHVFDAFIQSFTTYRPLLLKIKREYDHAFEDALKAAHENVRMRADLAVAEKEREHKVAEGRRAVQESTVRQKKAMQSRIKDLKSQIELSSAMAKEAEAEAHALRLQVKGARKEIRDMRSQSRQIQRQLMNDSAWQGLGSGSAALASVDSVPSDI
ncbi:hypothetical protein BSKO_09799 [Bryopsis sp. KO-2023]|nr:hypothetical protein BSKO_09799 [Bryopsis sp. KO-2023]